MSVILIEERITHYETLGRGKPLIFLHGWLGSWRYWMDSMEALSEGYRAHAFDLWGYGDSDKEAGQYDVDTYLGLLASFMDHMGISRAPLIAHSLGAVIAVRFAREHPERVPKLALVSAPLAESGLNRGALLGDSILGRFQQKRQVIHETVVQDMARTAPGAVEQSLASLKGFSLSSLLPGLDIPILAVYGRKDGLVDPSQAKAFARSNPKVRGVVMPDSGHFPMLDDTSRFNRLLSDYLETSDDLTHLELKTEWRRRTR